MRKLLALVPVAALGLALAACSSGGSSSTQAQGNGTQTCWQTGQGLVIESVSDVTGLPCSATYALGQPVITGPVSGDTPSNAYCTYSFTTITWWVWDTDNGASGNAEAFCSTLAGTPGASS
jgi:hypothetical protein